jgi:hypothetical protein
MSIFDRLFGRTPATGPQVSGPEREALIAVYMPSLAIMLSAAEAKAGRPLTEEEVLRIRDDGTCIMMRLSHAEQMSRGGDLDPGNIWDEWQRFRQSPDV